MNNKYYKYSTFAFCLGQINVDIPIQKDKYELKLPDPFSWKIYDNTKKPLMTVLFTELPFDFQSQVEALPFKRDTLEEAIQDDYRDLGYNNGYAGSINNNGQINKYSNKCQLFKSRSRDYVESENIKYEKVTYSIFIHGTEGQLKHLNNNAYTMSKWNYYNYDVNKIHNLKPIKPGKLVVKNIHYYGAWMNYTVFY
jgi:hypothetical protein